MDVPAAGLDPEPLRALIACGASGGSCQTVAGTLAVHGGPSRAWPPAGRSRQRWPGGGELTIVNCGHHPPLLRHSGDLRPLTDGNPALPLGLEDDFTAFTASWSPGDRLLLYADGLVESRDEDGGFLPEEVIATALLAADCDQALDTLIEAVHRHSGGHAHDDMALLLLEQGASPLSIANGHPVAARTAA